MGGDVPKRPSEKVIPAFLMWNIWRERNRCFLVYCEVQPDMFKILFFFFLRSLLDWDVVYVPSFSSSNLLDLVNFLDCRCLWVDCLSCILFIQIWGICLLLSIKLLFIKKYLRLRVLVLKIEGKFLTFSQIMFFSPLYLNIVLVYTI